MESSFSGMKFSFQFFFNSNLSTRRARERRENWKFMRKIYFTHKFLNSFILSLARVGEIIQKFIRCTSMVWAEEERERENELKRGYIDKFPE